jgi:hypothetical protein
VKKSIVPVTPIAHSIDLLRNQKVLLDLDLAALYEVPIGELNPDVKQNGTGLPGGFHVQENPRRYGAWKRR